MPALLEAQRLGRAPVRIGQDRPGDGEMSEIPPAQVRLATGVLESSNVNAVQEMSKLVQASRAYDQVAKVVLGKDDPNELRKLAGEDGQ